MNTQTELNNNTKRRIYDYVYKKKYSGKHTLNKKTDNELSSNRTARIYTYADYDKNKKYSFELKNSNYKKNYGEFKNEEELKKILGDTIFYDAYKPEFYNETLRQKNESALARQLFAKNPETHIITKNNPYNLNKSKDYNNAKLNFAVKIRKTLNDFNNIDDYKELYESEKIKSRAYSIKKSNTRITLPYTKSGNLMNNILLLELELEDLKNQKGNYIYKHIIDIKTGLKKPKYTKLNSKTLNNKNLTNKNSMGVAKSNTTSTSSMNSINSSKHLVKEQNPLETELKRRTEKWKLKVSNLEKKIKEQKDKLKNKLKKMMKKKIGLDTYLGTDLDTILESEIMNYKTLILDIINENKKQPTTEPINSKKTPIIEPINSKKPPIIEPINSIIPPTTEPINSIIPPIEPINSIIQPIIQRRHFEPKTVSYV